MGGGGSLPPSLPQLDSPTPTSTLLGPPLGHYLSKTQRPSMGLIWNWFSFYVCFFCFSFFKGGCFHVFVLAGKSGLRFKT